MSFTVDDFQDLLRLLAERPEWRAELRRQVLTDDLLELPSVVRQLAERMGQLAERMGRLEWAMERLADTVQGHEVPLGSIEGDLLELRYDRRAPAYFGPLARRLRVLDLGRLGDLLDDAVDAGQLTFDERTAVMNADVVLSGKRRSDQADIYLLAEVEVGIGPYDVERAAERAAILQKLGRPVVPIVGGKSITAEALGLADQRGVWQALDGRIIAPRGA